ncbi:MAG: DinB family protein [Hyphomicrobiales bacterium]
MDQANPDPIAIIAATPAILRLVAEHLPEAQREASGGAEWGPKEVVAHLLDTQEIAFVSRIRRIIEEDRPFIRSIDPPKRLLEGGYLERPMEELLREFERERAKSVAWAAGLDRSRLDRVGEHDEAGEVTASNILHYWARHDLSHLRQLLTAVELPLHPYLGNTKKFFEDV